MIRKSILALLALSLSLPLWAQTLQQLQQQMAAASQEGATARQITVNQITSSQQQTVQQAMQKTLSASSNTANNTNPATYATNAPQNNANSSCDCYITTNPYNMLGNNFTYSISGARLTRINPPCHCLPQKNNLVSSQPTRPIINQPIAGKPSSSNATQTTTGQSSGNSPTNTGAFNINYN